MIELPIDRALPEIVQALRTSRRLVLVSPPGSGKTTRVPPAILRAGLLGGENPGLLVLQPRRVAARAVAARIAEENGWDLGGEVGYHVRFEKKVGPNTRLRVLTEGLLNRQMVADPFLSGVGGVILDEFHERNLHTDLALGLLTEIGTAVREDLLLVVMSATLDAEPIARFLGDCPIVRVEGRTFPVTIRYSGSEGASVPDRVAGAVRDLADEPGHSGHVLAFLPGAEEIRRTQRQLDDWSRERGFDLLPLHGQLTSDDQDRAIRPSARRKIVLSTNIAETSVTIEGVTAVVDSGLARSPVFDPERGLDRLELGRISQASATQRAGRAGRTGPGVCVRLWAEREQRGLPPFEIPEIRRVDLASTVLALHAWGTRDPRSFAWFDPPPEESLLAAERLLERLGAITERRLTDLGHALAAVPAHPRIARILVESARIGLLQEGATLAAILSERDPVSRRPFEGDRGPAPSRRPSVSGSSDLLIRLDLVNDVERRRFPASDHDRGIDVNTVRQICKVRDDLIRLARRLPVEFDPPEDRDLALERIALLGYPDRVVRRRESDPATGTMVGGKGVRLEPESVVRDGDLFLAIDPRESPNPRDPDSRVRIASAIDPEWLEQDFPGSVKKQRSIRFDPQRRRVEGVVSWTYLDLVLREERHAAVDPDEAARVLAAALAPRARELFEADEQVAAFLARLDLIRKAMPEATVPDFETDAGWQAMLEPACVGKRSEDEVLKGSLLTILKNRLSYNESRFVEEHAPEAVAVPSGSRIRLTYEKGRPPVLAVRLQELFGWTDTPRIAGGRVPVVLHLLGPNYRPVQVTEDLRSFWSTTYFQVRKDLRSRYPKHSWPEDPLTAKPEAKGSRRNS